MKVRKCEARAEGEFSKKENAAIETIGNCSTKRAVVLNRSNVLACTHDLHIDSLPSF